MFFLCSSPSGNQLRTAAPTQTPSARPSAASSCTPPAPLGPTPTTAGSPAKSCCCWARAARSALAPPTPPAVAAAAASETPRLPPCLRCQPPPPPPAPHPAPLPRPWSTTRSHTKARPTSPASCPSPKACRSRRAAAPLRRGRACTTASWRSPTATASCRRACCPTWGANRLSPRWTQRAGAWGEITSSTAPPPRTRATTERRSSAPLRKSKAYLRRKNKNKHSERNRARVTAREKTKPIRVLSLIPRHWKIKHFIFSPGFCHQRWNVAQPGCRQTPLSLVALFFNNLFLFSSHRETRTAQGRSSKPAHGLLFISFILFFSLNQKKPPYKGSKGVVWTFSFELTKM